MLTELIAQSDEFHKMGSMRKNKCVPYILLNSYIIYLNYRKGTWTMVSSLLEEEDVGP